jgi:hypothetical protein
VLTVLAAALGGWQAEAAVLNVDQAELRAELHVLRALFVELPKAEFADFAAADTALQVVLVYACWSAVARVVYAALRAAVNVVAAPVRAVSRAFTAEPTQEIAAAAFAEFESPLVIVPVAVGD